MKRLLSLAIALAIAASASATSMRRYSLEEVRDRAESVFVGRVVSSSVRPVMNGQLVATDYTIEVGEVLAGTVGATTTVTFLGGKDSRYDVAIAGSPALANGRSYLFFRTKQPNNTTVGWNQGLYRVEKVNLNGTEQTVLISGDGEMLRMTHGRLVRAESVTVRDGALVKAAVGDAHAGDPRDGNGVALNADGTPARRVAPSNAAAAEGPGSIATMDDVRLFVRSRQ
ncbi:MAG TPA: hypothetical protein VGR02_17960 [Thermoanaerobaculia bacterium]|jgi:hypothetical protein|nr:hypothetical protein [Thermoanaerobaculia bacterium]